ncbi:MAG: phosphodiester glycosidase family protein [Acetatifactor sp.]|nr:phosphodiester glycosidase family protein [Acetatifactor sp.]
MEESNIRKRRKSRMATIIGRMFLVLFSLVFILVFSVVALCHTLLTGPSATVRDKVVLSAMQASATKWLPGLFLSDELVDEICARSADVQEEVIPMNAFSGRTDSEDIFADSSDTSVNEFTDEWADAIDGMIYKTYNGSTFRAYILIVKDPSRIYVGTSSDYKSGKIGADIFSIVKREGAVAAINAGEFSDTNGTGTGDNPIGLTYSKGECVWNDNLKRTFIGFDEDNVLHVYESMTRTQADELGIRDAVSFQTGNRLITNDGENVTLHYAEGNVGMAQRTAIAQRADGAVILVVTDGRTASSLGATRNDIIDLLASEGAVVAGMLDGGSSTMMYYEDYYTKYDIDTEGLDEYQRQGLTNRYKAFTKPRHMPTYFMVAPES